MSTPSILPNQPAPSSGTLSRRRFLQSAALASAAAPFLLQSSIRAASPNGKLNHACIGVGGMGNHDFGNFLAHPKTQIVALCDVDANHLASAARQAPGARTYSDWRELLAKEGDKIDSVNIAVPDHMHFPIAYSAVQAGKHVYCQKPLCHDVAEIRALTNAAIKKGIVSQLGTQVASSSGDRTMVALIKSGVIGKIRHAYLCSNRPGAIDTYRLVGPRPAKGEQPPAHLNWDLWIGSGPMRPYAPAIYHPAKWRAWQDFGTGWSGDIGCHIFDAVWKGLGLKAPLSVVAEVQESWAKSSERRADTWPQGDHITWVFPGTSLTESELILEWFDGLFYPPWEVRALYSGEYPAESALLIGSEGALLLPHGGDPILLPQEKFKDYAKPKIAGRNHYHHFVDACLGGEKTESHFAQSGPMTEAILLGTIALRVPGQKLAWDSAKMKFPHHKEAERYVRRHYRDGWKIENV
jgi:predicted dehydrogenase